MQISDVRVRLINLSAERLKAVCTVTFDGEFVVRDVKVVDGTNGLFVAMPSRKLSVHCPACKHKNHLRARFCNECGGKVPPPRMQADDNGRSRLHRDIAHPITAAFRELVQARVIEAFHAELEKAKQPGYEPSAAESEPEDESIREPAAEFSEYDAMIASLRGGPIEERTVRPEPGRTGNRDRTPAVDQGNNRQERGRDRQPSRRNTADRGDRNAPPRRDDGRSGGERGGAPSRGNETPNRNAEVRRTDAPVRQQSQPRPAPRPVAEERPRPEPVVTKPAASVPTRSTRPAPIATPPPIVEREPEESGFGEGIL